MRSARCPRCLVPLDRCFCADIPRIATRARVVIVRHAYELRRASNTGRIVAAALTNCELHDHGLPGPPTELALGAEARLLWPGGSACPGEVDTLVVLDGSWSQVRTMRARIPTVTALRSLSLPSPAVAPTRIRRAPGPDGMATIEAVAAALDLLGEPGPAEELRRLFERMTEVHLRMKGVA